MRPRTPSGRGTRCSIAWLLWRKNLPARRWTLEISSASVARPPARGEVHVRRVLLVMVAVSCLSVSACGDDDDGGGAGGGDSAETKEVTIGWTPPDITGVFKTATNYFEKAAADAKSAGFEVEVISRSPATH